MEQRSAISTTMPPHHRARGTRATGRALHATTISMVRRQDTWSDAAPYLICQLLDALQRKSTRPLANTSAQSGAPW